ncbi:protein of unknown function [Methylotuvimicrobium alcaliphilum 20Z]|uniref:Uncharacterized protein n=1 Tax=Methylotuvimicrobium alcaliphilum (strain DSM 19304 / NCIMB 14124 / VKM B-2133 / 20Z) TaxID=1091494 RepID=G4SXA1_META2|nr:protein of unknown function [Methylotuvimicrobium alcaliphilum 20Z]
MIIVYTLIGSLGCEWFIEAVIPNRRLKFGAGVTVKGRRECVPVGSYASPSLGAAEI